MSETAGRALKALALFVVYGVLILIGLGIEHLEHLAAEVRA